MSLIKALRILLTIFSEIIIIFSKKMKNNLKAKSRCMMVLSGILVNFWG